MHEQSKYPTVPVELEGFPYDAVHGELEAIVGDLKGRLLCYFFNKRRITNEKLRSCSSFDEVLRLTSSLPECLRFQETGDKKSDRPDTRSPVLKIRKAFEQFRKEIEGALIAAKYLVPADKINVSYEFFRAVEDDLEPGAALCGYKVLSERILRAADRALGTGRQSGPSRPPMYVYWEFVRCVAGLCHEAGLEIDLKQTGPKKCSGDFVSLVLECERLLPDELQGRRRDTVAERICAAVESFGDLVPR